MGWKLLFFIAKGRIMYPVHTKRQSLKTKLS